jgi:hypothetical protein
MGDPIQGYSTIRRRENEFGRVAGSVKTQAERTAAPPGLNLDDGASLFGQGRQGVRSREGDREKIMVQDTPAPVVARELGFDPRGAARKAPYRAGSGA